jgi:hypothetical protein
LAQEEEELNATIVNDSNKLTERGDKSLAIA